MADTNTDYFFFVILNKSLFFLCFMCSWKWRIKFSQGIHMTVKSTPQNYFKCTLEWIRKFPLLHFLVFGSLPASSLIHCREQETGGRRDTLDRPGDRETDELVRQTGVTQHFRYHLNSFRNMRANLDSNTTNITVVKQRQQTELYQYFETATSQQTPNTHLTWCISTRLLCL